MALRKRLKKVRGVGINDADYKVSTKDPSGATVQCPYYSRWGVMLARCYSPIVHAKYPNYVGCSVAEEWLLFSNFKKWMASQEWEGMELDKDILYPGNKVYSPDTCVFVPLAVNSFLNENFVSRGSRPIGVNKNTNQARCKDVTTGKQVYLGSYPTPEAAHSAWLSYKISQARILAARQTDSRVAQALIARYENWIS